MDPDLAPTALWKRSAPAAGETCSATAPESPSAVDAEAEVASVTAVHTASTAAPRRASATTPAANAARRPAPDAAPPGRDAASAGPDAASPGRSAAAPGPDAAASVIDAPGATEATLTPIAARDSIATPGEWSLGEPAAAAQMFEAAWRRPATAAAEAAELELAAECGGFAVYRMCCFYMQSQQLHFVFIKMEGGALWIWVGDNNLMLHELEAAFPLKRKGNGEEGAVASTLFADYVDSPTKAVASRLAQRFSVPIFLSVNVRGLTSDGPFQLFLQQLLQQQISSLLSRAQPTMDSDSDSTTRSCCPSLNGAVTARHG